MHKIPILLSSILLSFCYSIVYCQSIVEKGSPFIRNYLLSEYGFSAQTWAVAKDPQGIMYFGSQDGILEFDGSSWRLIETKYKTLVRSVVSDSKGIIYVGTCGDFGYLSVNRKGETQYESLNDRINPVDRELNDVWSVNSTSHGVYFFALDKIFRWFNDSITVIPLETRQFSNVINDQVYVLRKEGGIAAIKDGKYSVLPHTEKIRNEKVGITKVLPYVGNKLLIVADVSDPEYRGFFIYDLDLVSKTPKKENIPASVITPLKTDIDNFIKTNILYDAEKIDDHRYAFGTINGGIVITDEKGKILQVINYNRGIQNNGILNIFIDENKNIWTALNKGISYIAINSRVTQFNEYYGLKEQALSILGYNDKIYIGSFNGIYSVKEHNFNVKNDCYNLSKVEGYNSWCFGMISLEGNLFAAADIGVLQINSNKAVLKVDVPKVMCFAQSQKFPNYLFLGLYPGFAFVKYNIPKDQLNTPKPTIEFSKVTYIKEVCYDVRQIACDKYGDLWIVTYENRILHVKFDAKNINKYTVTQYDEKNGTPQTQTNSVYSVNNDIIICTQDGILKAVFNEDKGSGSKITFVRENTYGKLFNDEKADVTRVYTDNSKNIWVGSSKLGIVMLTPQNDGSYQYVAIPFKKIQAKYFNSFYTDKENVLWVGADDCLFRYDPTINENYTSPFNSLVRRVVIGKDSLVFNGAYHSDSSINTLSSTNQPIHKFSYKYNSVKFDFSSTFYEHTKRNRYQYILEGFDKEWSKMTDKVEKEYTNLPEGDYSFKVKCTNVYNHESSIDSYSFTILPPWYRTIWAFTLYLIAFVVAIFLIVKYYTKNLKTANLRLERIVNERTTEIQKQRDELLTLNSTKDKFFSIIAHDLRNPFNLLLGFSDLIMIKIKNGDLEKGLSFARIIHQTSATAYELLENLLTWSRSQSGILQYNPENLNIKKLIDYNILLLEGSSQIKGIKLNSKLNEDLFVYADKNMLFTILRNLITNAIKFSREGDSVTLDAKESGDYIAVSVSDTGIGIKEESIKKLFKVEEHIKTKGTAQEPGTGLGLILCKEFVTHNKGEIWVESTVDKGSCFSFTLQKGEWVNT